MQSKCLFTHALVQKYLVFSRNSFFIWSQKNVNLHKFTLKFAPTVNRFLSIQRQFIFDLKLFLHS